MRSFLQQFAYCLGLLRALPPAPPAGGTGAPEGGDTDMAEPAGGAAGGGGPAGGEAAAAAGGGGVDWSKSYRQSVEGTVGTYLVLMTNMRCAAARAGRWVLGTVCRVLPAAERWGPPAVLPSTAASPNASAQQLNCHRTFLAFCRFLPCSHAPMVINSPNSANLIAAPVPGAGKPQPRLSRCRLCHCAGT